jgi:hypothetical protein
MSGLNDQINASLLEADLWGGILLSAASAEW